LIVVVGLVTIVPEPIEPGHDDPPDEEPGLRMIVPELLPFDFILVVTNGPGCVKLAILPKGDPAELYPDAKSLVVPHDASATEKINTNCFILMSFLII
jgi:hypothetical protein